MPSANQSAESHPRRLGKYEIVNHIASGGMGSVYKAVDTKLGRQVAIKVLLAELAAKPVMVERFHREAKAAANSPMRTSSRSWTMERPLLAAIRRTSPPVLLIDEVDRADEEFEAFLLELLSDFQVSIPELGTIKATAIPRVVLTSNGTRELSDALRRRCLYHYIDFPEVDREAKIILTRLPGIDTTLALQIARMVAEAQGRFAQSSGRCRNARLGGDAVWSRTARSAAGAGSRLRDHDLSAQDP